MCPGTYDVAPFATPYKEDIVFRAQKIVKKGTGVSGGKVLQKAGILGKLDY